MRQAAGTIAPRASAHRLAPREHPPAQALGLGYRGPAALARAGARGGAAVWPRSCRSPLDGVEDPVPLDGGRAARAAGARAGGARRHLRDDVHARASHALGKSYADVVSGFRGRFEHPPDFVALPRERGGRRARCSSGARPSAWPRSPTAAAPPSSAASRPTSAPPTTARSRSTSARSIACSRSTTSRARRASRRARSGRSLEAQLRRARAHAAPLPAVVRVLHARGLDRDARGRPFRDAVDAHRGFRGVRARDHARRGAGSRGGCPGRARASAPIGCSRARRARSG